MKYEEAEAFVKGLSTVVDYLFICLFIYLFYDLLVNLLLLFFCNLGPFVYGGIYCVV